MNLFVCYSHKDRAGRDALRERLAPLEAEGVLTVWCDVRIDPGTDWRHAIDTAIRRCDAAVLLLSPAFFASEFIASVEGVTLRKRAAAGEIALLPIWLRSFDLTGNPWAQLQPLLGFGQFVFARRRDAIVEGERWTHIAGELRQLALTLAGRPRPVGIPYPGMRSFDVRESQYFAGRESEADDLAQRLSGRQQFVMLFGDSGSGKSSLAKAGIVPRLLARVGAEDSPVVVCKPRIAVVDDPFFPFAIELHRWLPGAAPDAVVMAQQLAVDPERVRHYAMRSLVGRDPRAELLVVVDQFEEIFVDVELEASRRFVEMVDWLAGVERVRVILTVRNDYYPALTQHECLARRINRGEIQHVLPLGVDRFREIIVQPAERAGFSFDSGLVDRIVQDARECGNEGAVVPLLAYALRGLLEPLVERIEEGMPLSVAERRFSLASYDSFGGVRGAVAAAAKRATEGIADDSEVLDRLGRELVTEAPDLRPARRSARRADLDADPRIAVVVERLIRERLLVVSDATVEVAHEALFDAWPGLRAWIVRHRDDLHSCARLELDAKHWAEKGRERSLLWSHERLVPLDEALRRLGKTREELGEPASSFARPEAERLLEEIADPATSPERRAWVGGRLGAIGDPRLGVGLAGNGLPEIVWCSVDAGEVRLTGLPGHESTARAFSASRFSMAKYPITRSQFAPFRERADGYANDAWWRSLQRSAPCRPLSGAGGSSPVGRVCWYEAVAYCRWLTHQYRAAGMIGDDAEVRLPHEWEWQLAASDGNPRQLYPWGNDFEPHRCNTEEGGLLRETAVGLFPHGGTRSGICDLSGSMWEWCLNRYEPPADCSIGISGRRPLRGGSWMEDSLAARVWFRTAEMPDTISTSIGLRPCLAPAG